MSASCRILNFVVALTVILQTKCVRSIRPIACKSQTTDVQDRVHFYLYTLATRDAPEEIFLDDSASVQNSSFNNALDTKFVIHDFRENGLSEVNTELIDGYLDNGASNNKSYNIIVVDWSNVTSSESYSTVKTFVDDVGLAIALFLEFLESIGLSSQQIGVVGYGMGAHIGGYVGKYSETPIATIIGLDPSARKFKRKKCRLNNTDANYVLVIHSAVRTRTRIRKRNGIAKNIGDIDFYINYGLAIRNDVVASHAVSYKVMANSLYPDQVYVGRNCRNYHQVVNRRRCTGDAPPAIMGGDPINTNITGIYEVDVDINTL